MKAKDNVDRRGHKNGEQTGEQTVKTGEQTGEQKGGLAEVIQLPGTKKKSKGKKNKFKGVRYLPPNEEKRQGPRVRYLDPDTGKEREVTLKPHEVDNVEGVRERIWHEIQGKRYKQKQGIAEPHANIDTLIKDAVDGFFTGRGGTLADKTQKQYRASADLFLEFCQVKGIRTVRNLNKGVLAQFVAWIIQQPLQVAKKGGKKGEKKQSKGKKLVNETRNKHIRHVRAVMNRLRKDSVIRLSRDDIADALEELKTATHKKPFLRPDKIAALIKACHDYDAKHDRPVLPVILFLLLTGMRVEEAVLVEWNMVEDQSIELPAHITKNKMARSVSLTVTPMLAAMLRRKGKTGRVLGAYTKAIVSNLCVELREDFNAPYFTAHTLRRTCGTYVCCAHSLHGDAGPHMAAARLGHGLGVSQKSYVGVIEIPRKAKTIEAAMQLEKLVTSAPRL